MLKNEGYEECGSYAFINTHLLVKDRVHELTNSEWIVFSYLLLHLPIDKNNGKDGSVYPSINTISENVRLHKRTIYKAIRGIEKKGFMEVKRINGEHNIYTIYKLFYPKKRVV